MKINNNIVQVWRPRRKKNSLNRVPELVLIAREKIERTHSRVRPAREWRGKFSEGKFINIHHRQKWLKNFFFRGCCRASEEFIALLPPPLSRLVYTNYNRKSFALIRVGEKPLHISTCTHWIWFKCFFFRQEREKIDASEKLIYIQPTSTPHQPTLHTKKKREERERRFEKWKNDLDSTSGFTTSSLSLPLFHLSPPPAEFEHTKCALFSKVISFSFHHHTGAVCFVLRMEKHNVLRKLQSLSSPPHLALHKFRVRFVRLSFFFGSSKTLMNER